MKTGSIMGLSWTSDGTQIAGTGSNGAVVFAQVVDVTHEDGRVRVNLEDEHKVGCFLPHLEVCARQRGSPRHSSVGCFLPHLGSCARQRGSPSLVVCFLPNLESCAWQGVPHTQFGGLLFT